MFLMIIQFSVVAHRYDDRIGLLTIIGYDDRIGYC